MSATCAAGDRRRALPRARFRTEELGLHPDGKHAYLGTGRGGESCSRSTISNPAKPVVTTRSSPHRRVNDIVTTATAPYRSRRVGAADRRNGMSSATIAIRPTRVRSAESPEGVTVGSVHSLFFYESPRFGRHIC